MSDQKTAIPLSISEKLLEVQKRALVTHKSGFNPFYKSNYTTIDSVLIVLRPIFSDLGLGLMQPIISASKEGYLAIKTILFDDSDSLEFISEMPMPKAIDPQDFGKAVTYLRRYQLVSMFIMSQEDDDGNFEKQNSLNSLYAACEEAKYPKETLLKAAISMGAKSLNALSIAQIRQLEDRIRSKMAERVENNG